MLYVMRHGRTDWNEKHWLQGRTDIPLNELGRTMAENAREEYQNVPFDICYCSPLVRARETAEILLRGRDIPILLDDRLMEIGFGQYEGAEVRRLPAEYSIHALFHEPENYIADAGAESLEALFARAGEFLWEVAEPLLQQGKDILVVGHGTLNSALICQSQGIPVKDLWSAGIENCKLKKVIG